MTIDERLRLSYYRTEEILDEKHGVSLVRHIESGELFVKKVTLTYSLPVYTGLKAHPVPGTPRIFELVTDNDALIIIEELVPGRDMRAVLKEQGRFNEDETLRYALQLCHILEMLHRADPPVIHRDIKPENIKLTPTGRLYLLDFNAARLYTGLVEHDTVKLGTPGYAAPEQYGFQETDPRADVFAVGTLLNEMLSGRLSAECRVSGPLEPVIRKCLEMDPVNRYRDAGELKEALQALVRDRHDTGRSGARTGKKDPHEPVSRWDSKLPPGFRSGSALNMLLAALGYTVMPYMLFQAAFGQENASGASMLFDAVGLSALYLWVVFFSFNYRRIQDKLPFLRGKSMKERILPVAILAVIMQIAGAFAVAILDVLIFHK